MPCFPGCSSASRRWLEVSPAASLLLLDEPSLGLAPIVVDQMFDVIRQLHAAGMTILLVEQNLAAALEIATRGYVIETGEVRLQGSAEQLRTNPKIRSAYLGL